MDNRSTILGGAAVLVAALTIGYGFYSGWDWVAIGGFVIAAGSGALAMLLAPVSIKSARRDIGVGSPSQTLPDGNADASETSYGKFNPTVVVTGDEPELWAIVDDRFDADITLVESEEGGRAAGIEDSTVDFHFDSGVVTGQVVLPHGSVGIGVGDTRRVGVSVAHDVEVRANQKFSIRQGGRTIGYGEIRMRDLTSAAPPEEAAPPIADEEDSFRYRNNEELIEPSVSPTGSSAPEAILPEKDEDTIGFYFATCRQPVSENEGWFSGERASSNSYGVAGVHVPPERKFGSLKRPRKLTLFSLTLYEQKENPDKHFIVEKVETVPLEQWKDSIRQQGGKDALIFVHGFNNSFEEAVFRAGQIFWDLKYDGIPVLFSWASRGSVANYIYDQGSALQAGTHFRALLSELAASGVTDVKILAHSMGNYMLVNALHGHMDALGETHIGELMMAAPDVDRDVFLDKMPALCAAIPGLTLYASKHDRALLASMEIAGGIPRAGFVTAEGPILAAGVDSIDVSEIGAEMFGLGHGAFASRPSVLNDIALLIGSGVRRSPGQRLAQLRGMPQDLDAKWWRFQA